MRFFAIAIGLCLAFAAALGDEARQEGEPYHLVKTLRQHKDGSWSNPEFRADVSSMIGQTLVVAIRYPVDGGESVAHVYGPIVEISESAGIVIRRSDGLGLFAIPPRAYLVEEHQRAISPTSMKESIRPDYSALVSLDGPPPVHGWNPKLAIDRK